MPATLAVEAARRGEGAPLARAPAAPGRRSRSRRRRATAGSTRELVARRRGRFDAAGRRRARRRPARPRDAGTTARARTRELLVYPDLPSARRLALAVRTGRFRESGRQSRGPLGLGTEFESIRDYLPDDDIRQVNWPATARMGRPMSNQYRIEQDRDVICVIDCGRLMAAPLSGGATRLDVAVDAATAVGLVADELGDRCGTVAFDGSDRSAASRRAGAGARRSCARSSTCSRRRSTPTTSSRFARSRRPSARS